jgi:hypothetical protein
MITTNQSLKHEMLRLLDLLPNHLWLEVLNYIKYLLFREQVSEQPVTNGMPTTTNDLPTPTDVKNGPLWAIVGMCGSKVGDLAINHDKYLAELTENRL